MTRTSLEIFAWGQYSFRIDESGRVLHLLYMIVFFFVLNVFVCIWVNVETGVSISVAFAFINQVAFLYGFVQVNTFA